MKLKSYFVFAPLRLHNMYPNCLGKCPFQSPKEIITTFNFKPSDFSFMTLVLDIGCGGSEEYKMGKERGLINIDIRKPKRRVENFILCDANYLPFKESCFDKALLIDVIEHLDNPSKALKEAQRCLKYGSNLIIGTPNALYLQKIIQGAFKGFYSPCRDHVCTWGWDELYNLLIRAEFKVINIIYLSYFDTPKRWYYRIAIKLCPFHALKHRQLLATATKTADDDFVLEKYEEVKGLKFWFYSRRSVLMGIKSKSKT